MEHIYKQALITPNSVKIVLDDQESVIFKGIKIIKNEEGIKIYSTDTDFYTELNDTTLFENFELGVYNFLESKYKRKLDRVGEMIQDEISTRKNHKRVSYLKETRNNLIEKYNDARANIIRLTRG